MQENKISVLLCTNAFGNPALLASQLKNRGFYVCVRPNNEKAILNSIINDMPDAVIVDLALSDCDAVRLMNKAKSVVPVFPQFIVVSDTNNTFVTEHVTKAGAAICLGPPHSSDKLSDVIKSVVCKENADSFNDIEVIVTKMIRNIGVPAHLKGYYYIRTAILECVRDMSLITHVTKQLYPNIAARYCTTTSRVERGIRNAIEVAWQRCDIKVMSEFFGYEIDMNMPRPTNSEFIALAADRIKIRQKIINASNGGSANNRYTF